MIECAWPGQAFLERTIKAGQQILVTGPVRYFHGRHIVPREQIVLQETGDEGGGQGEGGGVIEAGMVIPIYPATEGLSHRQIRRLLDDHLDTIVGSVLDVIPPTLRKPLGLTGLREAFLSLHRPRTPEDAEQGRRRLAFDELLDLQLVVARARHLNKGSAKGPRFENRKKLTTALKEALPFKLTKGQTVALKETVADMMLPQRMHRLLMGDVGTGKTVVALFAMLLAVENEYQAVFMAPTELLAEQHGRTIAALLAPLGIVPEVLLGRLAAGEKAAIRRRLAAGESSLVIGTHALIQETTAFSRLGLVVIDEQHRFGVEQRAALIGKGEAPDVLLLSATPIPRTLAMTLYGDLDISELREKPAGRPEIRTAVRGPDARAEIYAFIRQQAEAGRQSYVVYPVIEESERVDLKAATTMAAALTRALAPVSVALVHGRL